MMEILPWLLLGHFLGDWVLQNDWMARGKHRGLVTPAGLVHAAVYTTTVLGMGWLAGLCGRPPAFYLAFSSVVFLSHWLIDAAGAAERWMRLFRQSRLEMVRTVVDQTLHMLVLFLLVATLERWPV